MNKIVPEPDFKKMPDDMREKVKKHLRDAALVVGGIVLGVCLFWLCSEKKDRNNKACKEKAKIESARADSLEAANTALLLDNGNLRHGRYMDTDSIATLNTENDSLWYVNDSLWYANDSLMNALDKANKSLAAKSAAASKQQTAKSSAKSAAKPAAKQTTKSATKPAAKTVEQKSESQSKPSRPMDGRPMAHRPIHPVVNPQQQSAKDNFVQEQNKAEQQYIDEQKQSEQQYMDAYKKTEQEYKDAVTGVSVTRSVVVRRAIVRSR